MKLVVVDIQPEYESNTSFDIGDMLRKAAKDYSEVLFLFNGEDTLGMISESALKDFYFEKIDYDEEAFEDLLSKSTFFDKGYGFFRDVMDSEVCFDRSSIVKIVKYMIDNDVQDIRDLDEDDVDAIGVSELLFDDLEDYGFYLPDLADELPRWSGSDLAGGARNECMAEVEILGAAQGLSFNHIDDFIYEGENRYSSVMTESLLRSYIRALLVEQVEIPETLYHATYAPLADSIQKSGLGGDRDTMWDDSVRGTVYLAVDPDVAFSYAEASDDAWDRFETDEGLEIVTFEIDTAKLDPSKFNIDQNVLDNEGDTLEYHGIVPPSALKLIGRDYA